MIGWIGAILLSFCALPQVIKCYKQGHGEGLSHGLIIMWGVGEVLLFVYVFPTGDIPLIINYGLNAVYVSIIARYKYFPRQ